MTVTYKVLVIRTESPRRALLDGGPSPSLVETLFEAGGPDAGRLLAYAPAEVAAALTAAGYVEVPQKVTGLVDVEALAAAVAEPDEPAVQPAADDKPKRKRRTRAEIEAAKAAEQAAVGTPALAAGDDAPAPTSPLPADVPSPPNEPLPTPVGQPTAVPAPAAPAAPSVPYNPFA